MIWCSLTWHFVNRVSTGFVYVVHVLSVAKLLASTRAPVGCVRGGDAKEYCHTQHMLKALHVHARATMQTQTLSYGT